MILTIIAFLILLFFTIKYFLVNNEFKNINSQLNECIRDNSGKNIHLSLINNNLNDIVININKLMQQHKNYINNAMIKDDEFKELITNVSHDIRTPLTAIKGYLQLLECDTNTNFLPSDKKYLNVITSHTKSLENLSEQFFEFAYLNDVKINASITKVNIVNVINNTVTDYVHLFEQNGLLISITGEKALFCNTDIDILTRILENLIKNCITHSVSDVNIDIQLCDKKPTIVFKNSIDPDSNLDITKIFEKFYKSNTQNLSSGLGLYIVQILAKSISCSVKTKLDNGQLNIIITFD